MQSFQTKPIFILLFLHIFLIFGCSNSDSTKTEETQKTLPQLVGTWQQTSAAGKKVTDTIVKIIFSERTLTMDAPGCMIIGDYTTTGDVLTFTITSAQGERCAKDQAIGKSDSVHYSISDSQLILTPLLAKEENQLVYKRLDTD